MKKKIDWLDKNTRFSFYETVHISVMIINSGEQILLQYLLENLNSAKK